MKVKKGLTMCLAIVMAISAMSISAFAVDAPIVRVRFVCPQIMQINTDSEIREGVLPCGLSYKIVPMTVEEIEALNSNVSARSYSWKGNVKVPITNTEGTNGQKLGENFIIAPDNTAEICVGGLPSTMPTVNISAAATNGMWKDWIPNVEKYQKVILEPAEGYNVYEYRVKVSTSETTSATARFSIDTY